MTKNKVFQKLAVMLLGMVFSSFSADNKPGIGHDNYLFEIERSRDSDILRYKLKVERNGKLNKRNPIEIYWIRNTSNGQREPLSWIQKNYSYGIEYITLTDCYSKFNFAGYNKRIFELKKNEAGEFKVYTLSNGMEVEVKSIHIQIDGGTFLLPVISSVTLNAINTVNGNLIAEIINP